MALTWLLLTASGVLLFPLVALSPGLAESSVLMPATTAGFVILSAVTLLAGLVYLGTLATVLWRTERHVER